MDSPASRGSRRGSKSGKKTPAKAPEDGKQRDDGKGVLEDDKDRESASPDGATAEAAQAAQAASSLAMASLSLAAGSGVAGAPVQAAGASIAGLGSPKSLAGLGGVDVSMEQNLLNKALHESGERDRLRQLVRQRLREGGWRDELKKHCVDVIQRRGFDRVTVGEITAEVAPKARLSVPEEMKEEIVSKLRGFAESQGLEVPLRRAEQAALEAAGDAGADADA